jgi:hypothetical protein
MFVAGVREPLGQLSGRPYLWVSPSFPSFGLVGVPVFALPVFGGAWRVRGRRQGTARPAVGEVLFVGVPVFGGRLSCGCPSLWAGGSGKRGPAPKIQQQLEQIGKLPAAKQRAIAQVLDAMLQQHGA